MLLEVHAATKLTQKELASGLSVSQPTVNRILNGQGDCRGTTLSAIIALHSRLVLQPGAQGGV
ncbi:helix-turn-helix domain-containing protein [Burkholderia stagnalis]